MNTQPACFPRRAPLSPALAVMLSAFPGVGQLYVGHTLQGFLHMGIVGSVIALLDMGCGPITPLLGIFLPFFWIFSMVDAGRRASRINACAEGQLDPEKPDFATEDRLGLLVGGVSLTLAGLLALLHTLFGFTMAWVGRWWPGAVMVFGAWLVWRALSQNRTPQAETPDTAHEA